MSGRVSIIGLGAGGHAKAILEIVRAGAEYECVGLLDADARRHGQEVHGVEVLGGDALLAAMHARGIRHAFIGVGGIGDNRARRACFERARAAGLAVATLVHPRAIVSPSARLGAGTVILPGAIVHTDAVIGENVIVNTGAIVEHDCAIGDHVHIATGARLASTVRVSALAHIGAGATVIQCVRIGEGAVIGAGAVVIDDISAGVTAVGVPAKAI
ncbi:MAG: acetyltransferase [Deltaproteobacteria bacterium]|nr:acetyltransferase [Deltaproteobacteria bacterium]